MKNILFYSKDFNMCFSLLMYLQDGYKITTTTDIDVIEPLVKNTGFDLIILDVEPNNRTEELCREIKNKNSEIPIILTYVFQNQIKENESKIRKYVNSIFYKPFDLNEVSTKLASLMV